MQVIPVTSSETCPGYVMIELQGELCSSPDQKGLLQKIGTLCQDQPGATSIQLTIGHHQLSGKLVSLEKPLLVLQKRKDTHLNYQVS